MTEQSFNNKTKLGLLILLLCAGIAPVRADMEDSYCNASGHINIQNINLKGGQFITGQELQSVTIPFSYTCVTQYKSYGPDYHATVSLSNVKPMVDALKKSGLGMDVMIQEGNLSPVTFTWKEIQAGFSGWSSAKVFGQWLSPGSTYNLSGTVTLRIFVEQAFTSTFLNINIPASVFNILPYNPATVSPPEVPYTPLTVSAFNLRFIPDNSGRVIISPSVVRMGHFYTEYKETMVAREVPFTVTAQQNTGTQTPFVAPLAIEFQTNGLTLADADSSVTLKNTKGEVNGFRLSIEDDTGTPVKFNTKADMGSINLDNGAGGRIVKQYKAKVEPVPGVDIKTGDFSAAMTIVVTYI
ncbi:fimbrial protein [Salmonella enterica subsp. diarizonae]|nr:fimbrial protein [Salmonella enterica subsp. diarizonae]EDU8162624.1 fimbrial protein [Salmonella enterica subsp. diarizonae]EHO8938716.1 fimbrial protein [Salmonella enterica]